MILQDKYAVITGVSKGIGRATTELLLDKGCRVIGLGRTRPEIEHNDFHFFEADVTKYDELIEVFNKISSTVSSEIDILINNAGMGIFKRFIDLEPSEWQQMMDVNVSGIFNVTKMVLPSMLAQQSGHIINIASIAGLQGIPEGVAYCASKFAVRGFSDSLYKEVRKKGVKVSCIYPGAVNTEFFENYEGVTSNDTMLWPNDIAQIIVDQLEKRDNVLTLNVEVRPLNVSYNPD